MKCGTTKAKSKKQMCAYVIWNNIFKLKWAHFKWVESQKVLWKKKFYEENVGGKSIIIFILKEFFSALQAWCNTISIWILHINKYTTRLRNRTRKYLSQPKSFFLCCCCCCFKQLLRCLNSQLHAHTKSLFL